MAKNKISDLQNHLFEQIENLRNPEEGTDMELEIKKAKEVNNLAGTLVQSAKLELDFIKEGGKIESNFFKQKDGPKGIE